MNKDILPELCYSITSSQVFISSHGSVCMATVSQLSGLSPDPVLIQEYLIRGTTVEHKENTSIFKKIGIGAIKIIAAMLYSKYDDSPERIVCRTCNGESSFGAKNEDYGTNPW